MALLEQHGLAPYRILPSPEGGIGIYCFDRVDGEPKKGARFARIGVYNTGEIVFERSTLGSPDADIEEVALDDLYDCVDKIADFLLYR